MFLNIAFANVVFRSDSRPFGVSTVGVEKRCDWDIDVTA